VLAIFQTEASSFRKNITMARRDIDKIFRLGVTFLVFITFALLSVLVFSHHHEDGKYHSDCPLCIFLHSGVIPLDSQPLLVVIYTLLFYLQFLSCQFFHYQNHCRSIVPRAPPYPKSFRFAY
jgi:hypothetical protein